MSVTYYKVLNNDGSAIHGAGAWHLPNGAPAEWMPTIRGALKPCENGYHVCTELGLVEWLGPTIYEVEIGRKRIWKDEGRCLVVSHARLIRRIDTWTEKTARLFAADCAERVVHLTGPDERCVNAIRVARAYAHGDASAEQLAAAGASARDAAWEAAWEAAREAARAAARASARDAAWVAGGAAARAAARASARASARKWQAERLQQYLRGEVA